MSLSDKALLAHLKISQWSGRKFDRQASDNVQRTFSTSTDAGKFSKKLLPGNRELCEVHNTANNIRRWFYEQTLPWSAEGARILPSKNYIHFTREYSKLQENFKQAVERFVAEYPKLSNEAQAKLGGLFSVHDYPSPRMIEHYFGIKMTLFPMPDVGDFRVVVSEEEREQLVQEIRETEREGLKDLWSRLYEVVKKASERLSAPDAVFRDSLIENVTDICDLLTRLNVNEDATLESMRQTVESIATTAPSEVCRKSAKVREVTAKSYSTIASKIDAIMGGLK